MCFQDVPETEGYPNPQAIALLNNGNEMVVDSCGKHLTSGCTRQTMLVSKKFSSTWIPPDSQRQSVDLLRGFGCDLLTLGVVGSHVVGHWVSGSGTVPKEELLSILSGLGVSDRELPGSPCHVRAM